MYKVNVDSYFDPNPFGFSIGLMSKETDGARPELEFSRELHELDDCPFDWSGETDFVEDADTVLDFFFLFVVSESMELK